MTTRNLTAFIKSSGKINQSQRNGRTAFHQSQDTTSTRFRQTIIDNRRKVSQAMAQMMADDARRVSIEKEKPNPSINKFLNTSLPTTEATFRPKVLSLTG